VVTTGGAVVVAAIVVDVVLDVVDVVVVVVAVIAPALIETSLFPELQFVAFVHRKSTSRM
jgi:hypothetical protein